MSATKPQDKPSALKVVPDADADAAPRKQELDMTALDQALESFAGEQQPMMLRAGMARNRIADRVREVETGISDLSAREAMLDRLVEAAKAGLHAQREDLEQELSLYLHGINGIPS